jgi:MFS transporter, FHS family, glucose/mannose:H+ symporter
LTPSAQSSDTAMAVTHLPSSALPTRATIATAHVAFILTGTVTTLLGPLLPVLVARWELDDARAGYLFTAQFVGSMLGVALSGRLVTRFGFARGLSAGLAAMAAGVGALGVVAWPQALVCVACYGVGLGITIPATNLLIADAKPERRAEALNILNLAWGIGAVAAPPAFAWFAARDRVDAFLFSVAASLVGIMAVHVSLTRRVRAEAVREASGTPAPAVRWRSPAFLVYGALFFVYVGTENALAGWIAAFAQRLDAAPIAVSTSAFFWAGLLGGRAVAPLVFRRSREAVLVQGGLALAALGVALVLTAANLAGVMAGAAISGLGLSIVFPTTIAQLSQRFAGASAPAAAAAFALAGLGGATVPWLVGFWSTAAGSLRAGLVVPLLGCFTMMALHAYRSRSVA